MTIMICRSTEPLDPNAQSQPTPPRVFKVTLILPFEHARNKKKSYTYYRKLQEDPVQLMCTTHANYDMCGNFKSVLFRGTGDLVLVRCTQLNGFSASIRFGRSIPRVPI